MSDTVVATAPAVTSTKSTKKAPKAKKISTHPKYSAMISEAIQSLKEKSGSSRQAIVKYIIATFKIDEKTAITHVKLALKRGVQSGSLKQVKGIGASGSFKLVKSETESKPKKAAVKTKKPATKKPAAKKSEKTLKKKVAKKPTSAKKSPAKKSKAKKSPAKKSAKPKKPVAKKAKK